MTIAGIAGWKDSKVYAYSLKHLLDESTDEWVHGLRLGNAQNFARELMECPANHLTPSLFVAEVLKQMENLPVEITSRYPILFMF